MSGHLVHDVWASYLAIAMTRWTQYIQQTVMYFLSLEFIFLCEKSLTWEKRIVKWKKIQPNKQRLILGPITSLLIHISLPFVTLLHNVLLLCYIMSGLMSLINSLYRFLQIPQIKICWQVVVTGNHGCWVIAQQKRRSFALVGKQQLLEDARTDILW